MKNKLIFCFAAIISIALLLFAGCAAKTPQDQLQINELDKQTYQNALSAQNSELCGAIEDKDLKTNCETTIKEQKLKNEIVAAKDASKCSQLTIETLKKTCEIEVKSAIEAKKTIEEAQKEAQTKNDLLNQIISGGNIAKCADLKEKNFQNICKDSIYFNQAVSAKDAGLCKKISDKEKQVSCENISKL
ncbi:hypothetical protein HZA39_03925 [Candidatus Peregrinibacteria bacterium]|nr:hypothetical protein [Candidatus Peregrinibacteria bacterium]